MTKVGKRKVPRGPAADGEPAYVDEGIACVEGAVALVEKGDVAGNVAGCRNATQRAEEFAFLKDVSNGRADAGEATCEAVLRLSWQERFIGRPAQQGESAGVRGEGDAGQFGRQAVDRADVVYVSVGEDDALDRESGGCGCGEDGGFGVGEAGVDEREGGGLAGSAFLADEVAVD